VDCPCGEQAARIARIGRMWRLKSNHVLVAPCKLRYAV